MVQQDKVDNTGYSERPYNKYNGKERGTTEQAVNKRGKESRS